MADLANKEPKKDENFHVSEIFRLATERGWNDRVFEEKIAASTGHRIPFNSLKYWRLGHSLPRISEVEWMYAALGYELEAIQIQSLPKIRVLPPKHGLPVVDA